MEFYSPVNTVKVMSSQSVNLLAFFLGRLSSSKQLPSTGANIFASNSQLTALLESMEGEWPQK